MVSGAYQTHRFEGAADLVALLEGVTNSQALCASLPLAETGRIVSKAMLAANPGAISRTKDCFSLPAGQRGLFTVDYDPAHGVTPLTRNELLQALFAVAPGLAVAGCVWWASGSSNIFNGDVEAQGVRGQRVYFMARDLEDVPRAMETLTARMWLHGFGRIEISSSGGLLERTLVDPAFGQCARIDFIGGAVTLAPVSQRRGRPVVICDGGWADTRAVLPDLTTEEANKVSLLIEEAKNARKGAALAARHAWRSQRISEGLPMLMKRGLSAGDAEAVIGRSVDAAYAGVLLGPFELTLVDDAGHREVVTVEHILNHRDQYQGRDLLCPLNPKHRGGAPDCRLFLMSPSPVAYSLDDGGQVYRLRKVADRIECCRGQRGELIEQLLAVASRWDDVYMTDGGPVLLERGRALSLTANRLLFLVATRCALFLKGKGAPTPMDLPREVADLLLTALN